MKTKVIRQWELGLVFSCSLLVLAAAELTCLFLVILKGDFSIPLLVPVIAGIVCLFFAYKFFSMWNTLFLISKDGVQVVRHCKASKELEWKEITNIYVNSSSLLPRKKYIIFSAGEIGDPFGQTMKKLKNDPDFLAWISYTAEKERILREFAEDRISKID